jgi:hypothetical protein
VAWLVVLGALKYRRRVRLARAQIIIKEAQLASNGLDRMFQIRIFDHCLCII